MYYNNYEDYMRSVLGYNMNPYDANSYMQNRNQGMSTYQNEFSNVQVQDNIEDLYPDIYKIVYPMVCKVCQNNTRPITNELVEQMTMEIYNNIEADDINIVNINVETRNLNTQEGSQNQKRSENRESSSSKEKAENRQMQENRQRRPNNPLLRDLIRILILNRLFGGFRPGRPPFRPPFPGRPPMMPRYQSNIEAEPRMGMYEYDNFLNF